MAREQFTERQPQPEPESVAVAGPAAEPSSAGSFVTQGPIPPVETAAGPATATASERAFGQGPGIKALEALLAKGAPKVEDVVALIDANRGEHDAMLGLLSERLGGAYAQSVRDGMGHLRASISRREVVAGDPADPASGYIVVSQQQGGAKWKTAGGGFTGTVDKNGLDSQVRLDEDDALHAKINKDKTGTLAWERDGKNQGELYGRYGSGKDYEAGVRRQFDVGGGTLTAGARHRVDGSGTTDGVYGTFKNATTTADADLGVRDGHLAASASAQHDFGGGYTGTAQLHHGADGTSASLGGAYKDGATTVNGSLGVKDGHAAASASFATTHGADQLSGSAAYDGKGTTLDLKDRHDFGGGYTGTAQVHHGADGTSGSLAGTYKNGATTVNGSLGVQGGQPVGAASIATTRGRDQFTGSIAHDGKGTTLDLKDQHDFGGGYSGTAQLHHGPEGTTGMIGGAYKDSNTQLDGNITRALDRTSLHLGGTQQLSPQMSVTGAFDHVRPDVGASQSTLNLSERYRSGEVIQGANLEVGHGARDYLKASGSVDARLAPRLYGGLWAGSEFEQGHQTSAQLGGSLTFSTNEKTALTLAGLIDQDGRLETRLQFDLFKSKIEGIGDLDREKKNALVSLFLSYSQGGNGHALDQRYGEPQMSTPVGGSQVMAGIKIRF